MIRFDYTTTWEGRWSADSTEEERYLTKLFTYKDLADLFHKQRFGYFPSVCVLDKVENRITHGQIVHATNQMRTDSVPFQVNDPFPRLRLETGPVPQDLLPDPKIKLRDYQSLVTQIALSKGQGIIQIGTGGGKTVIMGSILKYLIDTQCNGILILIYSKTLLNQTAKRLISYGVKESDIGVIHSQIKPKQRIENSGKRIVLSTHLSIKKFKTVMERTEFVLCDEAHQSIGTLWKALFGILPNIRNVIGFTATPWDNEGESHEMLSIYGQKLCDIPIQFLMRHGYVMTPESYFIKLEYKDRDRKIVSGMDHNEAKRHFILSDQNRNLLPIVALNKFPGRRMLVLYESIQHGKDLKDLYAQYGFDVRLADGGSSEKKREEVVEWFESECEPGQKGKILLGSKIFDTGLDLQGGTDILFILAAGKKPGRQRQRIGRALRWNRWGRLLIFDCQDSNHKILSRWSGQRRRVQNEIGIHPTTISIDEFADLT